MFYLHFNQDYNTLMTEKRCADIRTPFFKYYKFKVLKSIFAAKLLL